MKIKIFWQENCPTCPPAKRLGQQLTAKGRVVELINAKEIKGLTQAIKYSVMATPSIIIVDEREKEIAAWRSRVPNFEEVENLLAC